MIAARRERCREREELRAGKTGGKDQADDDESDVVSVAAVYGSLGRVVLDSFSCECV